MWCDLTLIRPQFFVLKMSSLWKSGGYIRFGLSVILSVHLSVRHNFVSAKYLENSFIEFIQILYVHWYWHDQAWDCYLPFFPNLYQSNGPWFMPKFRFRSTSWEQIGRNSPNFIYAFILTISSLGLLRIIFCSCVPVLWPFIYAKISFPLNIFRTHWQNLPNFIYAFIWQDLRWDCHSTFFAHLYQSYGPWFAPKFHFLSISWEQMDRI